MDNLTGETSLRLLEMAKAGDGHALNELLERYLPRLRRAASGRVPSAARGMLDTEDVVHDPAMRSLHRLDAFEIRGEGALLAYLRHAIRNRLVDAHRRHRHQTTATEARSDIPADGPSPLEEAVGSEALERYEAALLRLRPDDREILILRIELCHSYDELAQILEKPSRDACRVAVTRALARLSVEMGRGC
jgi:RNA polymerase sigma-70 factor (ECF subfamily)